MFSPTQNTPVGSSLHGRWQEGEEEITEEEGAFPLPDRIAEAAALRFLFSVGLPDSVPCCLSRKYFLTSLSHSRMYFVSVVSHISACPLSPGRTLSSLLPALTMLLAQERNPFHIKLEKEHMDIESPRGLAIPLKVIYPKELKTRIY